MADRKPTKLSSTQHLEPYSGSTPDNSNNDRRGLAQFEKQRASDADFRVARGGSASRGNQRWGGGGVESSPPRALQPKQQAERPREDDDLVRERGRARFNEDDDGDDGMQVVSGSQWGESSAPSAAEIAGARRGKGRKQPEPEPEYEYEEEEEAPKKSKTWLWVTIAMVVVGGGGATAAVLAGGSKPAEYTSTVDEDAAAKKKADEADAKKRREAAEKQAAEDEAAAKAAREEAEKKAVVKTEVEKPKGPAEWAPNVEATNPWVAVAAAPSGTIMGISQAEATNMTASLRTGFRPSAAVPGPDKPYRMSTHEVTWGELATATNIPEVVTLTRPTWLPRDASNLPATGVPWSVAQLFCQGMGGDLPSEAEWEWAARGTDWRPFPWGTGAIETSKVHIFAGKPAPVVAVKTSKLDVTPGDAPIYDLLGNAEEWTRDAWRPAEAGAPEDPKATTHKAVRGWPLAERGASIPAEGSSYRAPGCAAASCMPTEGAALERVGFRCTRPQ